MRRLTGIVAGSVVALVGLALPASALGIRIGGLGTPTTSLVHVNDCRSAALTRAAGYNMEFSSKTTGPVPVHVNGVVDGSLTLCYSLDVAAVSSVNVVTETYGTVEGVVSGIVTGTDGSGVCTAIKLTVGPGVKGSVSATSHAHVAVDGAPPFDWDHQFAKDIVVDSLGEEVTLKACVDSSGSVSAS
jgi:hypothetical protein